MPIYCEMKVLIIYDAAKYNGFSKKLINRRKFL